MKKIQQLFFLLVLIALFSAGSIKAEVKLPAIFGDHMVLQQQTNAAIWGKATPGRSVKVNTSWNKKSYTATADK